MSGVDFQEAPHDPCHLIDRRLQQEVAAVEKMDLGFRRIGFEGMRACGTEDFIASTPHRQ
jgi:hypothetical protein